MKTTTLTIFVFLVCVITGCKKKSDTNNPPVVNCIWTTVFSDNFHRADTTLGTNYQVYIQPTPTGGSGFIDLFNNSLRVSSENVFWAVVYLTDVIGNKARVSIECSIPDIGGQANFAVGGKFSGPGTSTQSGYFAGVMNNGIGINKIVNGVMTTLASQAYTILKGHTYKIALTIDGGNIAATVTELASGSSATVSVVDTGPILTGKEYSINGNSLGGQVDLLFHNYLIETCQ